jgi:inhibitor of cysteine peptidase
LPDVTLTQADDGTVVEVAPSTVVVVRLPENSSTGFNWAVDRLDDRVLGLQSSDYGPPTGGAVGGAGWRSFAFRAMTTGSDRLRLKLWRHWQGDDSIIKRFGVTIRVQG